MTTPPTIYPPNTDSESRSRSVEEIVNEIKLTNLRLLQLQLELADSLEKSSRGVIGTSNERGLPLSLNDYARYGRQMILSQVGLSGQLKLNNASVLVIGAGGLGCPALLYLVRAGVGNISIVDHDTVELSNLHRQVLHTEFTVGINKAESAKIGLLAGNPSARINAYTIPFSMDRLFDSSRDLPTDPIHDYLPELDQFSLVLDCTDNPDSRYLISDACAAYGIPLVSGAAIRTEGQLSIWNLPPPSSHSLDKRGPCYRCIFPETEQIRFQKCSDEGVLGPVVGLVGVLMAWEAIRLLLRTHDLKPNLLLVPSFRKIKLRHAKSDCIGCSLDGRTAFLERLKTRPPNVVLNTEDSLKHASSLKACSKPSQQVLSQNSFKRITARDLILKKCHLDQFWVLDVRPETQFGICSLPNSINIPITEILDSPELTIQRLKKREDESKENELKNYPDRNAWLVVCRRGNDSLLAVEALNRVLLLNSSLENEIKKEVVQSSGNVNFVDLDGGLEAYGLHVDTSFPVY